jgi:NTP pyrophosphatase (non-canonical NTP hydrolase)
MNQLESLTELLIQFRNERDWEQFHNPKDLALGLSIEANELLELYLWKKHEDVDKEKVADELADVITFALYIAHNYQFDITEIVQNKVAKNAAKYPVDKAKGNSKKYTEL